MVTIDGSSGESAPIEVANGSGHRTPPSSFGSKLVAGVFFVLVGFLLSFIVTRAESLGYPRLLLLETRPRLFVIGLLAIAIYAVLLATMLQKLSTARRLVLVGTAPLLVFGIGLVLAGVSPGSDRLTDLAYVPSARPLATSRYAVPVLFDTGQHSLTAKEQARLKESLRIFAPCGLSEVQAIGFASSTGFRRTLVEGDQTCDSDCRNLRLANLRGVAVREFVQREFEIEVRSPYWIEPAQMFAARRLVDNRDGRVDVNVERLNRRAELSWTTIGCR